MTRHLLTIVVCAVLTASVAAQSPAPVAGTSNPELVGALAKELGLTPQQAEGAAGSLFNVARSKLQPNDWSKVASAVPGMAGMLKAAPAAGGLGGIPGASALGGAAGLAGAASSFTKLGLKPELVVKAVPILTSYVTKTGGTDVGGLLAGALK